MLITCSIILLVVLSISISTSVTYACVVSETDAGPLLLKYNELNTDKIKYN